MSDQVLERRRKHENGLAQCLSEHFSTPVEIDALDYLTGGSSRILAKFTAKMTVEGRAVAHRLVFRLDPESSFVESDRGIEFRALAALKGKNLPVPEPVYLDADGATFGRPFLVMTEMPYGRASSTFETDPYGLHATAVGRELFSILGRMAAIDIDQAGLRAALPPVGESPGAAQLDYWEAVVDADEKAPQPIVRAGIRALRRQMPPPPPRLSVVHGDLRSGNFLFDGDRVTALLDWEFVHLGDPLEDIAWCADPYWSHGNPDRIGGMLPLEEAIAQWEAASGQPVDPVRFDWWRLFSAVKAMAMWNSATDDFLRPDGGVSAMTVPALACAPVHERMIVETLLRWEDRR